jgi:rRNA-processing protein FCF1
VPTRPPRRILVLDANILIDFWESNRSLLRVISAQVGPIVIPTVVFDEVEQLTVRHCRSFGIEIVEPTLEQLTAASREGGGLSLEDQLCLAMAQERGALCVTNDGLLRQACANRGVPVLWGLELLALLVEQGHTTAKIARRAGIKMRQKNRHYITETILQGFLRRIGFEQ